MTSLDIIKKMTTAIEAKCAERIELSKKDVHKPHIAIEEHGISTILKQKRGL
jgi:hypothetical protein